MTVRWQILGHALAKKNDLLIMAEKELVDSEETTALDARGNVISLTAISEQLEAHECNLEYFFMGDDLLIWIISEKGMIASRHQQESAGELSYLIERFRKHCAAQLSARQAGMLAAKLLQPIANVTSGFERIVIVPHGAAHNLPFHLLPLGGRHFGDSHTRSQLPSASVLQHLDERWQGLADTVLAVGNPSNMVWQKEIGGEGLRAAPLFHSEVEATAVSSFFRYRNLLLREEATKERVLELIKAKKVVHLATNEYTDAEQPELSGNSTGEWGSVQV